VADDAVDVPQVWRHLSLNTRCQDAVRPVRLPGPGM